MGCGCGGGIASRRAERAERRAVQKAERVVTDTSAASYRYQPGPKQPSQISPASDRIRLAEAAHVAPPSL